jgi:hypothetical protein
MRTGCIVGESPKIDKEIFMKSKPAWVPSCQTAENQFKGMPGS